MPYNQFTLQKAIADFGLTLNSVPDLFPGVPPVPVPHTLRYELRTAVGWATIVNTEAARSQFLIAPVLWEVWRRANYQVALYSGTRFDVDEAAGLTGVCDFVFSRPPQVNWVTAPVLMIVEAKNEDIWGGIGQCAAELVAAQRFNQTRNPQVRPLYGASTDGSEWRFLRLDGADLDIDGAARTIAEPDVLVGILFHILGVAPAAPVAA